MITLATLAYADMDPVGPPPTVQAQELALQQQIAGALGNPSLATQQAWTVPWVGLSAMQGNFCYLAQNAGEDQVAVVLRGSVFKGNPPSVGPIDVFEDLAVWRTEDLPVAGTQLPISAGAMTAFTDVTTAIFDLPGWPLDGTTLLEALTALTGPNTTIYVTGHSLGGCLTTTVALYLHDFFADNVFQVYNFAGPTAGLAAFADQFDQTFGGDSPSENASWRVVNVWDVVPMAWHSISQIIKDAWYPSPGPAQSEAVKDLLEAARALPDIGGLRYVQPSTNPVLLNAAPYGGTGSLWDSSAEQASVKDFLCQMMFQHYPTFTYMPLLGAPPLPQQSPTPCSPPTAGDRPLAAPTLPHALLKIPRLPMPRP